MSVKYRHHLYVASDALLKYLRFMPHTYPTCRIHHIHIHMSYMCSMLVKYAAHEAV